MRSTTNTAHRSAQCARSVRARRRRRSGCCRPTTSSSDKLQVVDMAGNVLLALTRPAKVIKSKVLVSDGTGREIGSIVQQNAIGKIHFGLESGGHAYGSINAENWRA